MTHKPLPNEQIRAIRPVAAAFVAGSLLAARFFGGCASDALPAFDNGPGLCKPSGTVSTEESANRKVVNPGDRIKLNDSTYMDVSISVDGKAIFIVRRESKSDGGTTETAVDSTKQDDYGYFTVNGQMFQVCSVNNDYTLGERSVTVESDKPITIVKNEEPQPQPTCEPTTAIEKATATLAIGKGMQVIDDCTDFNYVEKTTDGLYRMEFWRRSTGSGMQASFAEGVTDDVTFLDDIKYRITIKPNPDGTIDVTFEKQPPACIADQNIDDTTGTFPLGGSMKVVDNCTVLTVAEKLENGDLHVILSRDGKTLSSVSTAPGQRHAQNIDGTDYEWAVIDNGDATVTAIWKKVPQCAQDLEILANHQTLAPGESMKILSDCKALTFNGAVTVNGSRMIEITLDFGDETVTQDITNHFITPISHNGVDFYVVGELNADGTATIYFAKPGVYADIFCETGMMLRSTLIKGVPAAATLDNGWTVELSDVGPSPGGPDTLWGWFTFKSPDGTDMVGEAGAAGRFPPLLLGGEIIAINVVQLNFEYVRAGMNADIIVNSCVK